MLAYLVTCSVASCDWCHQHIITRWQCQCCKSMEKWKIRPPLSQKPLNRSSLKFAWVITSGPYPYAKCHHDTITTFAAQICENVHQVTRLVFWFFLPPTTKTPAPIFTIGTTTSYSHKDVPFGDPENNILHFDPVFPPKFKFFANFRRDLENFATKRP